MRRKHPRFFTLEFDEPMPIGTRFEGWNKGNFFRVVARWRNKHLVCQVAGWR